MFLMLQYFTFHLPPGQNERVRIVHMQEEMPKPLLHADRLNPYCLWRQGQAMRVCVCVCIRLGMQNCACGFTHACTTLLR